MYQITSLISEVALGKAGLDKNQIEDAMRARSLPAFAESALGRHLPAFKALQELRTNWRQMDNEELSETLTSAHFAGYFGDVISRMFYNDYKYAGGEWTNYVFQDKAPNGSQVKRLRMTEPEGLTLRGEKENHKDTFIRPSYKQYGWEEWSRKIDFSWRTILDDDLGKIQETATRFVGVAARSLNAFVSNLYDNAVTQGGLVALGANYAGTGRLTLPNLAIGINGMKQRADALGNPIDVGTIRLVIPQVLEVQASAIFENLLTYGGPGGNNMNRFVANYWIDPYIAFVGANVPWYLVADPMNIPAITLCRLQGWDGPVVVRKTSDQTAVYGNAPAAFMLGDFNTGNIEYAVIDTFGGDDDATYAGVTDFQGIYYSSGTTA
jgi:hypothetical protein